ncbi:MAG: hypothetical protein KAJ14_12085 [Candidatus Omnitrophica bacterium]|nr:hypothetical protein [Candidatus Omnitrophota bacterium]MCK5493840.1 hypothetical protein [Candidatus Omnitrophota bacterium]
MKKQDKIFILFLSLSSILISIILIENVYITLNPKTITLNINVNKIKNDIKDAGLIPYDAKYWDIIKK